MFISISERIAQALDRSELTRAIEFRGEWATWRDMGEHAHGVQEALAKRSLGVGARVALVARNRPSHVSALLGLMAVGFRTAMVYAAQPEASLARELVEMSVPAVIADEEDWTPGLIAAMDQAGLLGIAISGFAPGKMTLRVVCELNNTQLQKHGDGEIAIEMLSSGTTGKPKRIAISYATLDKAAAGMVKVGDQPTSVDILPFPIGNISGLYFLIPTCLNQQPLVLLEKFRLDDWLRAVRLYRPAYCALPPPAIRMILDRDICREDLAGLAAVGVGASPLDPFVQDEFEKRYGIIILIGYGATEFGGVVVAWTPEDHKQFSGAKRGSVGRVRDGIEVRIVGQDTQLCLPSGEVGLLEAKVDRIGPDWIQTTDLALIDEDGFVYIKGRADDTINRGGFKVQPEKIESVLRRHPAVVEAAVVGEADSRLGEVPVAIIELFQGKVAPTRQELDALVRALLRPQEVPVRYAVMEVLPRTASMKVRRGEVRSRLNETSVLS